MKENPLESPYTPKEWAKIEKLASVRGKRYKTIRGAKKYLASPRKTSKPYAY